MRTCISVDPSTLDPRKTGDAISSTVVSMLYEGLTQLLENGEVEMALAESFHISKDERTYTFHLRSARWSDGSFITALDFEYSWKKTLDPAFHSSCPQLFFAILNAEAATQGLVPLSEVGVRALDDRTLQVELEHRVPYFLSLVSSCCFFPISKQLETQNPFWESAGIIVSSGPFLLSKWEKRKELRFIKSPSYWDADKTSLKKVSLLVVNDEYETLALFENEEVDWLSMLLCSVPSEALDERFRQKKAGVVPFASTVFCAFNTDLFPFNNLNIRKAFSAAIDRTQLVEEAIPYYGTPAKRLCHPSLDHQNCSLIPPFNPSLARTYLQNGFKELGISKEADHSSELSDINIRLFLSNITLTYENTNRGRLVAKALQKQWSRHLGFQVKLTAFSLKEHMERVCKRDFNISLNACAAQYSDPLSILDRFKYKKLNRNFSCFESDTYIELLNRSATEKPRNILLQKAESHLLDCASIAPLYHFSFPVFCHSCFSGVRYSLLGSMQFKNSRLNRTKINSNQIAVC